MFTVSDIKKSYPAPVRSGKSAESGDSYCIGGAFCRYAFDHGVVPTFYTDEELEALEEPDPFPGPFALRDFIRVANPAITMFKNISYAYAVRIINANDEGKFTRAWNLLAEALAWTPEEEK